MTKPSSSKPEARSRSRRAAAWVLALLAAVGSPLPASAGTVERIEVATSRLRGPLPVMIYRPDGAIPDGGFPVLTLLHGLGGSETDWLKLGGVEATLDGMIQSGAIKPVVVAMPGVGSSWYVDSSDVGGPGDVPGAIAEDLRHALEGRYRVRKDAGGRAVAGLSMGGYGALRLGFSRPDLYGAIAALSPAVWQNVPAQYLTKSPEEIATLIRSGYFLRSDTYNVTGGIVLPPAGPHFGGMFGNPFQATRFNSANVFTLIADAVEAGRPLPPTFVSVGDDDSHLLWRGSIALFETMKAGERPLEFRVTDGDHVWSLWARTIRDALLFIDGKWTKPPLEN